MPQTIHLAFLWHQHQPYYRDDATGESILPWVRMHGVKDYTGLPLVLQEFPGIACTIHLVPSLLSQLESYVAGQTQDRFARLASVPPAELTAQERAYVVDGFFWAHSAHMVGMFARYAELQAKRNFAGCTAEQAARAFTDQDILDLTVLWNLAWCHRLLQERQPFLVELAAKGRGYTLSERDRLHQVQREVLGRVIPLHRELAASGRIELSTSPYYHPILPLLCRPADARAALPELPLPANMRPVPEDAAAQLHAAVACHERLFGARPRGLWPSEGSVSDETARLAVEAGFQWLATDEEILSASLGADCRSGRGEALYRPWELQTPAGPIACVFRDHKLSDLLGFDYQHRPAASAAEDFVARIKAIRGRLPAGPALVSVILDGENPWESYPGGGVPFLRELFTRLGKTPAIRTTTISAFLAEHPPRGKLRSIFPGSWIRHDFAIWIGHEEDRIAWGLLHDARAALVQCFPTPPGAGAPGQAKAAGLDEQTARAAWEEIYQAEGSDWYWWFGDDHRSQNDLEFDVLFRRHLRNVYRLIGHEVPADLDRPVKRGTSAHLHTLPTDYLKITVDGKLSDYFEWIAAGHFHAAGEMGAMDHGGPAALSDVRFGFDRGQLFVRCDLAAEVSGTLRVEVTSGDGGTFILPVPLSAPAPGAVAVSAPVPYQYAVDRIVELAVSLEALKIRAGTEVLLRVSLDAPDGTIRRYPASGPIRFKYPERDLHRTHWVV